MKMKRIGSYKITLSQIGSLCKITILPNNLQVEYNKVQPAEHVYSLLKTEEDVNSFIRFYMRKINNTRELN